jgi:glycosyltransferase involved in cell wall biosynthesis
MAAATFSVLLPTRDRLDLAMGAIETVRSQTFRNWEIVVADNCSAEDVAGYIASLSDNRIVYTRSNTPLPVTANWSRALDASSGEFIIMLGDDDGLVPGYFERLLEANDALEQPDFIYHGAYHFAFPGALPNLPQGALTDVTFFQSILRNRQGYSLLEKEQAHAVARAALDMRAHYAFNMQHFLFNRRFVDRMAEFGAFFQGPFPDFYAANMSMLKADRIGLLAEPAVIIGISPKSYGFFHFNKREKGGISFLNTAAYIDQTPEPLRKQLLPGTNMNSSWLVSVALIAEHLGRPDLRPNVARYRRLQIIDNLKCALLKQSPDATLVQLWPHLTWSERLFAMAIKAILLPTTLPIGRLRNLWGRFINIFVGQYLRPPRDRPRPVVGRYQTMMDVFEGLRTNKCSPTQVAASRETIENK